METDFVAVAVVQSSGNPGNGARMELLSAVIKQVESMTDCDGVILFPAGHFNSGPREANTILQWVGEEIRSKLAEIERNIVICVGIDGYVQTQMSKDQLAVAVGKEGIKALGRKFYPAKGEMGKIHLASDHLSKEQGYARIFSLNAWHYYIAVCYDVFGIKHEGLPNPGVDVILDFVHDFWPRRQGPSGHSYFARHGFAGASKQWECPVFGAAVFFNRDIPESWPSGVLWTQGDKSTKKWRYEDNPIKTARSVPYNILEGKSLIRTYDVIDYLQVK